MNIIYNKDKVKLCSLLIERIIHLSTNDRINIAVSGGSTPNMLFSMMGEPPYSDNLNWENINIYWVDERCVSPDDDESNYKMAYDYMLSKVAIPKENIFRIKGESDPYSEVLRYNSVVTENIPLANGFPSFDVALMGVGDDGHTSSIFYGQMHLLESELPYAVATNPYTNQKRIAMTGKTIINSKELIFLVTGENKKSVLSDIIEGNNKAKSYPAYFIMEKRTDSTLYTDVNI